MLAASSHHDTAHENATPNHVALDGDSSSSATPDHWPTLSSSYFDMRRSPKNNNNSRRLGNNNIVKQEMPLAAAVSSVASLNHQSLIPEDYLWDSSSEDLDDCWSTSSSDEDEVRSLSDFISPKLHTTTNNNNQPTKSILRASSSATTSTQEQNNKTVDFSQDDDKVYKIRKRTSRMNKSTLYYTDNEISQFKQEYKDEKKMLKLQEQRGFAELLDDYDDNKQDGDEGGEEDSSPSTTTSCQDAKTNDDIETHHAKEEEASCDNKDNTDDMDDMYKAQHYHLVSVLNLIFAFKRQEDIIERLEQDNARMIQWWWRRRRSRQLAAIKQQQEGKVTTKSRKRSRYSQARIPDQEVGG